MVKKYTTSLCVNLRVLGKDCDKRHSRKETTYMTVEGLLKKGFQATVASRSKEKKEAAIGVVNNLFKVYFSNNAVRLLWKHVQELQNSV